MPAPHLSWTRVALAVVLGACGGGGGDGGGGGGGGTGPTPTTGTLSVVTATSGLGTDPDAYTLSLDGAAAVPIGLATTLTFDSLSPGAHALQLAGLALNCTASGGASRSPSVTAGQTTTVTFSVGCRRRISNQVVYQEGVTPSSGITLVNPDGTGNLPLLNDGFQNESPAVSPDGMRVAFISTKPGHLALYVMSSEGTSITLLAPQLSHAGEPSWSPDGTRIVFLASRQDSLGINSEVAIINADGSNFHYLTHNFDWDGSPSWSPDGSKILFTSQEGPDGIYVMDTTGANRVQIPGTTGFDQRAKWSPDGARIAFHSLRDGNWEIYSMLANGTDVQRLTTNAANDWDPAWSPDGSKIIFESDRSGGQFRLWTITAADGSNPSSPLGALAARPHWAP